MAKFRFFKRTTSEINGEVTLTSELLRLLAMIDEKKEISQIARDSGFPLDVFKQNLSKLFQMGLIVPVENTIQKYNPAFLKEITHELMFYVGPVAEMIISDTLSDLNISDERIPVTRLDHLISLLSEEIPVANQKQEFDKKIKTLASRAS